MIMSYKINDYQTEELTHEIEGVHDLVEIYGDEILKNSSKQIKILEGIYSVVKKINIPNEIPININSPELKLLKNKINVEEKIKQKEILNISHKVSNNSKLEQFELEEKTKKKELDIQIKKELLKKQKEDELLQLKLKKQKEDDLRLQRILKMFSSKNTVGFPYGIIVANHQGMNQVQNSYYEFKGMGCDIYILTLEILKKIKSENKEVLTQKYNMLTDNYIWIKKFIMNEGLNPLISFVLDEMNINDMIMDDLKTIEEDEKTINMGAPALQHRIQHRKKRVCLLSIIKKKQLRTKEFYIVNNDEFCKDFEINDFKLNISQAEASDYYPNERQWTILKYWVRTKQSKLYELIQNIQNIHNEQGVGLNWKVIEYYADGQRRVAADHVLQLYCNYINSKTQRTHVTEHFQNSSDIVNDYIPEYFEPLMSLSKIIIDMIDFIHNE